MDKERTHKKLGKRGAQGEGIFDWNWRMLTLEEGQTKKGKGGGERGCTLDPIERRTQPGKKSSEIKVDIVRKK